MQNPEDFALRQKCIIVHRGTPTPHDLQTLEKILGIQQDHSQTIIKGPEDHQPEVKSTCCTNVSNELFLMAPALATTACCLYATNNLSCSDSLAAGLGSYICAVLCLADENESLSRETYSGKAAVYLKRRLKEKTITLFPCLASKKIPTKDE
jgi:hypothetical protein